ncbi:hypothetical protein KCU88_g271, partial [Aureobasidium melanogenum]
MRKYNASITLRLLVACSDSCLHSVLLAQAWTVRRLPQIHHDSPLLACQHGIAHLSFFPIPLLEPHSDIVNSYDTYRKSSNTTWAQGPVLLRADGVGIGRTTCKLCNTISIVLRRHKRVELPVEFPVKQPGRLLITSQPGRTTIEQRKIRSGLHTSTNVEQSLAQKHIMHVQQMDKSVTRLETVETDASPREKSKTVSQITSYQVVVGGKGAMSAFLKMRNIAQAWALQLSRRRCRSSLAISMK